MTEIIIDTTNENQRLDKYLIKYLNTAPKSFVYKMIRKKNIKINGKKTEESYVLKSNDILNIYLSDETITKFKSAKTIEAQKNISIIYEDENVLIMDKPIGLLSHSSKVDDTDTMISRALYYLYKNNMYDPKDTSFTPALANRLDRNTSGLIILGKNLKSLQELNRIFKEREVDKFYRTIVSGHFKEASSFSGYHVKDNRTNTVKITPNYDDKLNLNRIETGFNPICSNKSYTLLEVQLITGKTHQIREHLNFLGYPIVGDRKYGNEKINKDLYTLNLKNQLLHSYEVRFRTKGYLSYLNEKNICCPTPEKFKRTMKYLKLDKGD